MWRVHTVLGVLMLIVLGVAALVTPTIDPGPPPPPVAAVPATPPASTLHETALERRETLEGALVRSGIARAEAREMVAGLRGAVNMRRLRPGERLLVTRAPGGAIEAVAYVPSALERHELRRDGDGWSVETQRTPVETRVVAVAGRLEDSLFASIERLGESAVLTAAFVRLFEWDVDFAADSLPGDGFRLLVEKRYAAGELIGYGDILVAQYETAGRPVMTGVAFGGDDGQRQHFDADGRSVKKMFLRAPLDFTRVTSGFSHARRHPILGGLRPHLAIDYGAPTGTPVRAVADGTVAAAGWSGGNGISVTLSHARGYQTMYNHLSAAVVRPGQRVRQRDVIGRVGATGLATGPHLDYRVSRNGQFVNPLGEKFIPGAPVPPERRRAFRSHLAGLLERLDRDAPLPPRGAGS
jgi:murein DD-endopeptidase MepM/ murein hydrolase activator NlpD